MKRVRPQRGPLLELIPDFCRGGALLTQAFILQLVAFVLTLAGALLVQAFSWLPQVGAIPAMRSFVIVVLGGLGSLGVMRRRRKS